MNAVNVLPKVSFIEVPELFKGRRAKKSITAVAILENDSFRSILRINRASHLLYTVRIGGVASWMEASLFLGVSNHLIFF